MGLAKAGPAILTAEWLTCWEQKLTLGPLDRAFPPERPENHLVAGWSQRMQQIVLTWKNLLRCGFAFPDHNASASITVPVLMEVWQNIASDWEALF